MKFKVNKYYKTNWFTKEKPEYGYFLVTHIGKDWITIMEANPWGGGPWKNTYTIGDTHLKNAVQVPDRIGAIETIKCLSGYYHKLWHPEMYRR